MPADMRVRSPPEAVALTSGGRRMTLLTTARLIDDTRSTMSPDYEGDAPWRPSTWVQRTGYRSWTGRRRREARRGIGAGSRRPQRSHDLALDDQRGRQPARDGGRCPLAGRRVLVPDGRGHPEGPQRRARSALLDRRVDPRRGRRRRGRRSAGHRPGRSWRAPRRRGQTRLAGGTRRERLRHHRAVQRTGARTAAVERVPRRATLGDRGAGHRAGDCSRTSSVDAGQRSWKGVPSGLWNWRVSVGGPGEFPAAFVDEVMVVVAEQGEVVQ